MVRTALLTATALCAAAALGATGAAAAPPPIALTSGHADWGVRETFRNYILGPIAHGQITASDGATVNADGTFRFTLTSGSYDPGSHAASVDLGGTVRFTGHDSGAGPLLDLTIADPRVETAGDSGTLYADVRSKDMGTGEYEDYPDVDLAALDLSGSAVVPAGEEISIAPIAATLTANGSAAFSGLYPAGTPLDPLALSLSYAAAPPPPPRPDPAPNPTPPPVPEPDPEPTPKAASIAAPSGERRVGARGLVALARVTCGGRTCTLTAPERVLFSIAGHRYRAIVLAPKRLGAGRKAVVRLKLHKRAMKALAGRRTRVALRLRVRSGEGSVARTIRVTLARAGTTKKSG